MNRFENLDIDQALRLIVEGTAAETGTGFYAALVKSLSATLNTTGAWVTEYLEDEGRLRALAFWLNGGWISNYEYALPGTPCELVIRDAKVVHVAQNVSELFPDDPDLKSFNAVSYMGVPLMYEDGSVMGHLAILDSNPLPADPRLFNFFRIFAVRAAAEHQRLRADAEIREREEKLNRLIGSAMDAIVELDENFNISLVNKAATEVFKAERDQLLGQDFQGFLTSKSRAIFLDVVEQLNAPASSRPHVWIPAGLAARDTNNHLFPLEATLSFSQLHRRKFYTLILRNVNEREEAVRRIEQLTEQAEYLKEELKEVHNFDEIIGESDVMLRLMQDVRSVAATDTTVLVLGETGTGKELIARAIHNASPRRDKPLIRVSCAALPATLIESELFGHERGSFTGATAKRTGRFQLAHDGSIFLDEVGELPLELQAKLLRVLQEGEFEPLGSSRTIKVDVRVIAATNRDLARAVETGQFREDLYYRLNVFPLTVPPLRDRKGDIALLANAFLSRTAHKLGRGMEPLSDEEIARLLAYEWPGNVRELQNVLERSVIVSTNARPNFDRALPLMEKPSTAVKIDKQRSETIKPSPKTDSFPTHHILTVGELQELEKQNILRALAESHGRIAGEGGAAQLLGMKPSTLNSRLTVLGIKKKS